MSKKWSPSAKYCASILHIVASIAIMEQVQIQRWNLLIASGIIILIAAVKEFWADMTWLENDSLKGSGLDFFCYSWGVGMFWASTWMLWSAICTFVLTILIAVVVDMSNQGVLGGYNDK